MSFVDYAGKIKNLIDEIEKTQHDNITRAAEVFADAVKENKIIHVFGTGHSHMVGIEMFVRAGGLANVNAMLDGTIMTHCGAQKGSEMERLPGLAKIIWEQYDIQNGDVMIIISSSGRNAVPVEMAALAKQRGIYLIALTSLKHYMNCKSRHASGKRLFEFADLVIDNCVPQGDCLTDFGTVKSGPASTIAGALIVNGIVVEAVNMLIQEGIKPPVYVSQNVDGYDNDELYIKYGSRIKHI